MVTVQPQKSEKAEDTGTAVPAQLTRELWLSQFFKNQEGWLKVLSGSMHPLLPVAARIFLKPVPLSHIRPGDVVVFRQGSILISHWVIKIQRKGQYYRFIQQGNCCSAPAVIDGEDILGKVLAVEHGGKTVRMDTVDKRLYSLRKVIIMRIRYELYRMLKGVFVFKK